jgi:hypothetical protein
MFLPLNQYLEVSMRIGKWELNESKQRFISKLTKVELFLNDEDELETTGDFWPDDDKLVEHKNILLRLKYYS